jgi:hypothetical protein
VEQGVVALQVGVVALLQLLKVFEVKAFERAPEYSWPLAAIEFFAPAWACW